MKRYLVRFDDGSVILRDAEDEQDAIKQGGDYLDNGVGKASYVEDVTVFPTDNKKGKIMSTKQDHWSYVYARTAQRARRLVGLSPDAEVRLAEEQIDGALPCWAVKVPTPPPKPLPPPAENAGPKELSHRQLAIVAKGLLLSEGGFTLDEYGKSVSGNFWAVSVPGCEEKFPGQPSIDELKAYLDRHPINVGFFGGWYHPYENIAYLDHTELYAYKSTAVQKGKEYKQKAIYHLLTGETIGLEEL